MSTPFCGACGERRPGHGDLSLRHLARELVEHVTSLDGRLVRSLLVLVTRPGALTADWIRGARSRATPPLQLFLLVNLLFFLLAARLNIFVYRFPALPPAFAARSAAWRPANPFARLLHDRFVESGLSPEAFQAYAQGVLDNRMHALMALYVVAVAIALHALHAGTRRFLVEHVVLATHFVAFAMLLALAVLGGAYVAEHAAARWHLPIRVDFVLALLGVLAGCGAYLALALRRVYASGWPATLVRTVVVCLVVAQFGNVYYRAVMWTTLLTL